jgi:uncharacterized membrane protein YkvA (DUF1232 family)
MTEQNEMNEFGKEYSDENFWKKVKKYAKVAGSEVIDKALRLYYALMDKDTPVWAKSIIVGTLAYFISPIDAIPDAIPVAGYADDLGAIAAALAMVAAHIKPEHIAAAKDKAEQWFGKL